MAFRNSQAAADPNDDYANNSRSKRQRPADLHAQPMMGDDAFQHEDGEEDDEDDDEEKTKDKKAGRRKIKIEFIQDKSRRHITFSKRKAGIMKKAYELSTLTGTQVLLLVVSETGLVYTFTTAKLQPLVTQPEGKNLIQACLNAPHGQLPSSMPVGTPIGRSTSGPTGSTAAHTRGASNASQNMPGQAANVVGGLAIGGGGKDSEDGEDDDGSGSVSPVMASVSGNKRGGAAAGAQSGGTSTRPRRSTSGTNASSGGKSSGPHKPGGSPPQAGSSLGGGGSGDLSHTSPPMPPAIPGQSGSQAQGSTGYPPHHHGPQHHSTGGYANPQSPLMHSSGGGGQPGGPGGAENVYGHHPAMMAPYHMGGQHSGAPPGAGGNMHTPAHWGAVQQGSYQRR